MAMMTETQLSEIEKRCQATPEGPWLVELQDYDTFFVAKHVETAPTINAKFYGKEIAQRTPEFDVTDKHGYVIHNPDMCCDVSAGMIAKLNFIAYTREDIPKLLAEVRELRAKLESGNIFSTFWQKLLVYWKGFK
jgi:hypothetical protein